MRGDESVIVHEDEDLIQMVNDNTVEVSLPSEIGYERVAMECCAAFAKLAGFDQARIDDLKTAVAEACINAIQHGNKGRPEARVAVTMNFKDDSINVAVRDEGEGLAEVPNQKPDIDKWIKRLEAPKLGLFLIKELVDHVDFQKRSEKGHVVSMTINLAT